VLSLTVLNSPLFEVFQLGRGVAFMIAAIFCQQGTHFIEMNGFWVARAATGSATASGGHRKKQQKGDGLEKDFAPKLAKLHISPLRRVQSGNRAGESNLRLEPCRCSCQTSTRIFLPRP